METCKQVRESAFSSKVVFSPEKVQTIEIMADTPEMTAYMIAYKTQLVKQMKNLHGIAPCAGSGNINKLFIDA